MSNLNELLAMGGYGLYVWGSLGMCAAAMGAEVLALCPAGTLQRSADATTLPGIATSVYLAPMNFSERRGDLFARMDRIGSLSPEEQAVLIKDAIELDREEPLQSADFETYMNGLLHLIEIAGVDHVCFGADWDGGGGVDGPQASVAVHRGLWGRARRVRRCGGSAPAPAESPPAGRTR